MNTTTKTKKPTAKQIALLARLVAAGGTIFDGHKMTVPLPSMRVLHRSKLARWTTTGHAEETRHEYAITDAGRAALGE